MIFILFLNFAQFKAKLLFFCIYALSPMILQKTNGSIKSPSFFIGTKFSDLINANVNVIVDPLRIIFEGFDQKKSSEKISNHSLSSNSKRQRFNRKNVNCMMTIHRKHCATSRIQSREQITWDTRICFKWKCSYIKLDLNTSNAILEDVEAGYNSTQKTHPIQVHPGFVMRVESCWTGSIRNPIFIISKTGCTNERTMISSPTYNPTLDEASSLGWLSVRLAGTTHVRLACAIRVCNICDSRCTQITPPKCMDYSGEGPRTIWENKSLLNSTCAASPVNTTFSNLAAVLKKSSFSIFLTLIIALLRSIDLSLLASIDFVIS